jgi:zinc RING finger of MSL2
MSLNPLNLYIRCSRLVFSVKPCQEWDDYQEFEEILRNLYESCLCFSCKKLLVDPVVPKKHHFSCQHRVCLDCIGKKRSTPTNCKMCSDYTLFEKSHQTKLILRCFKELCELVNSSWIYDFVQRQTNHDTDQAGELSLGDIIDAGMNYGQVSIVLDETSSDENSSSSDADKETTLCVPYSSQIFPSISPISPDKRSPSIVQSSTEQFTIIPEPVIPLPTPVAVLPVVSSPPVVTVSQIVQYQSQILQPAIPSTSKMTPNHQQIASNFMKYPSPMMRLATSSQMASKPMAPVKIQSTFASPTPTIYSVMYTGSGNKITLKRKPPEDVIAPMHNSNNVKRFF